MILLVRISKGSDIGDTDNQGCTVIVLCVVACVHRDSYKERRRETQSSLVIFC